MQIKIQSSSIKKIIKVGYKRSLYLSISGVFSMAYILLIIIMPK